MKIRGGGGCTSKITHISVVKCPIVHGRLNIGNFINLSAMEFIVSLFSNACTISLLFLKILCTFHYIKDGISHSR